MSSEIPWADARAKITAAALGLPINWPNEPFTEPTDTPGQHWLSVWAEGRTLDPIDIGAGVWQEDGTLHVDIIAPLGYGTAAARAYAKTIVNLFRGLAPPQTVIYLNASIGSGQPAEPDGIWWVLPVSIDWRYQDQGVS